jgi:uncharacterized membrane protein (UPF0127 family)
VTVKRLLALAFVLAAVACSSSPTKPAGATTNVVFPGGTISSTIASSCAARTNGLMNVTALGANAGMLFVFAENHDSLDLVFYMKDTPIPLSIAFIDSNNQVINIDDMAAETLTQHKSKKPFRYALEVNLGWLAAHGVAAGTSATFALPAGTITDPSPCVQ